MAKAPIAVEIRVTHFYLAAVVLYAEIIIRSFKSKSISRLANKYATWFFVRWCISQRIIEA